jgi:hypothetical protein
LGFLKECDSSEEEVAESGSDGDADGEETEESTEEEEESDEDEESVLKKKSIRFGGDVTMERPGVGRMTAVKRTPRNAGGKGPSAYRANDPLANKRKSIIESEMTKEQVSP